MPDRDQNYHSFMLRLWRAGNDDPVGWRISLEAPGSGEKWFFSRQSQALPELAVGRDLGLVGVTKLQVVDASRSRLQQLSGSRQHGRRPPILASLEHLAASQVDPQWLIGHF